MNLVTFLSRIDRRLDALASDEVFHPAQREMLLKSVRQYRNAALANPHFDPLSRSLFYFVVRAWGRDIDEEVELTATFITMYLLSADLLDDVQDDDLAEKPHASLGPAFASNDALTLLFLGMGALCRSLDAQTNAETIRQRLQLFQRTAILAASGQHRDLMGAAAATTTEDVLGILAARNSSISMILGLAALLSGCGREDRARYQRMGEKLALFVQIPGDLRDIFGKAFSPDLATGKVTYPIACFRRDATLQQRQHLDELIPHMPESIRAIRELFYAAGVVEACASKMEELREEIHVELAATGNYCAVHRCLLGVVDGLAGAVYEPPELVSTASFFAPDDAYHTSVRRAQAEFASRVSLVRTQTLPKLRPWHLPQWMYLPERQTICYPDIVGMGEEILPWHAQIIGTEDLDSVAELLPAQVPALIAHEMFHFLRHATGRMTSDHWHEEWVANRLAVAYLNRYAPDLLSRTLQLANSVLTAHRHRLDTDAARILNRCERCDPSARDGYGVDALAMAAVSMEMIRRLATQVIDLDVALAEHLSVEHHPAAGAAA